MAKCSYQAGKSTGSTKTPYAAGKSPNVAGTKVSYSAGKDTSTKAREGASSHGKG